MKRNPILCVGVAVTMLTGGCSTGTFLDDVGTLWGEPSKKEVAEASAREQAILQKVPVQSVGSVEIGRTRDGILVTAIGTADRLGYSLPTLRARRNGQPGADGFIDLDFVATQPAPELNFPVGTTRTRALRADLPISLRDLGNARGIRVIAATNARQIDFAGSG